MKPFSASLASPTGFEFVEFAHPDRQALAVLFETMDQVDTLDLG
jgi:4-hydroxyphenylpyruvate dioxygenase-like putative hemolysin